MESVNKEWLSNWVLFVSKTPAERLQQLQLLGKIKCPFCGKEFDREEDVMQHIQKEHDQEDPEDIKLK